MAWPLEFAYAERDSGLRRDPLPFQVRVESTSLKVHVDPSCDLDAVESAYLEMLARNGDRAAIELVSIVTSATPDPSEGAWIVDLDYVGPSGQLGLTRTTEHSRQGRATRFHVPEFAKQLADRHGLDRDRALEAHARYEAALRADVDVYVTTLEPLFGYRRDDCMFACRPNEALAVLGLFQRLHRHLWVREVWDSELSVSWAEFAATWALVPELRGMFPRQGVDHEQWSPAASLLQSARTRLERVLGERDELIAQYVLSGRTAALARPEVLLERIALSISGLFDALGRATNRALELGVKPQDCSFSRGPLLRQLPSVVRDVVEATRLRSVLRPIGYLRNTIHHDTLGAGAYSDRSRALEPLASIPVGDAEGFLEAMSQLPQLSRWTVGGPGELGLHVRPLPFVEELLPMVVESFRQIVAACPWPGEPSQERFWYDEPVLHEQLLRLYGLGS